MNPEWNIMLSEVLRECKCSSYVLKSAREYSLVWCKYWVYFNSIIYNLLYFIVFFFVVFSFV
jgi:hypothetical protein